MDRGKAREGEMRLGRTFETNMFIKTPLCRLLCRTIFKYYLHVVDLFSTKCKLNTLVSVLCYLIDIYVKTNLYVFMFCDRLGLYDGQKCST